MGSWHSHPSCENIDMTLGNSHCYINVDKAYDTWCIIQIEWETATQIQKSVDISLAHRRQYYMSEV